MVCLLFLPDETQTQSLCREVSGPAMVGDVVYPYHSSMISLVPLTPSLLSLVIS